MAPLLEVRDLRTYFRTENGLVKAVDGVSLDIEPGTTVCLVGESGSGKSVMSLSIMRLVERPGRIVGGEVRFKEQNLLTRPRRAVQALRGSQIAMIFQEPKNSLNPVFRIGRQIAEALEVHGLASAEEAQGRAIELLRLVGIPDPEQRARQYPHQMSGGMAQRVMIAMALACSPELLIADEPTTALDVTIQAQILDLLRELREQTNISILLITHNMGVVAEMADRVAVMYAGRILEEADSQTLFDGPAHPYTVGLLYAIPVLGEVKDELAVIPGTPVQPINLPPGCRFAPRCQAREIYGLEICAEQEPELIPIDDGHHVRCWLHHPDYRPGGPIDFGYENTPPEQETHTS
jgi:peptide/nickel transport system ATP-binding protein